MRYQATLWEPPSRTFGSAPYRAAVGVDRYGRKPLSVRDANTVRMETLLAVRTAEGLAFCIDMSIPFCCITIQPLPNQVAVTDLDEFLPIVRNPDVSQYLIDEPRFGISFAKPMMLLVHKVRMSFVDKRLGFRKMLASALSAAAVDGGRRPKVVMKSAK